MCSHKPLMRATVFFAAYLISLVVLSIPILAQYQLRPTPKRQTDASITVTDPSAKVTWEIGKQYSLRWESSGVRGSVKLKLESVTGESIVVAASTRNSGSYTWTVKAGTAEGEYRLVVTSLDGKTVGKSSGSITIQKRALSAQQAQTQTPQIQQQENSNAISNSPSVQVQESNQPRAQTNLSDLNQTGAGQMTGFVSPDLEVQGIQYRMGRLHVSLRNNGLPFDGSVSIRLQASEPADGFTPYSFDEVIDMAVSVGPGQVVELQLGGFTWPSPVIDHHWLIFSLVADPANQIVEGNEMNNYYQESICRPCNMEITGLSHSTLTSHDEIANFRIYGRFGSTKGTKYLQYEVGDQSHELPIGQWSDVSLQPDFNIGALGNGTYGITAFCRHPAIGAPHASNTVTLRVNSPTNNSREPVDVRRTSDALGEEFGQGLDFSSKIESLSTQTLVGYRVRVRCHIDAGQSGIDDVVLVTHELWRDGYRVAMWEDPAFEWNLVEKYLSHTFEDLSAGNYEYRARIRCRQGTEDSKSIDFDL